MVNILHIGRTDTPHVCDVIAQIKEKTDFKNSLISCKIPKYMPDAFYADIPTYFYNYLEYADTQSMRAFVDNVVKTEKPDLVIGHSFSQVAIIMRYLLTVHDVPAMAFIWNPLDCIHDVRHPRTRNIYANNIKALEKINYLLTTNIALTNCSIRDYRTCKEDFVDTCPPVNLAQYTEHIPNVAVPKLLLAKGRCEQYVYTGLPYVLRRFPNLEVHAFYRTMGIALARKAGIYNKIIFHNFPLPQTEFSDLIKQCNIVHTVTPDAGTGNTALQASYAGCANLMRRCDLSAGILDDRKNAIMCMLTTADVTKKLVFCIKHVKELCAMYKENNKGLIRYDRETTWKALYQAILTCLDNKKGKILAGKHVQ